MNELLRSGATGNRTPIGALQRPCSPVELPPLSKIVADTAAVSPQVHRYFRFSTSRYESNPGPPASKLAAESASAIAEHLRCAAGGSRAGLVLGSLPYVSGVRGVFVPSLADASREAASTQLQKAGQTARTADLARSIVRSPEASTRGDFFEMKGRRV